MDHPIIISGDQNLLILSGLVVRVLDIRAEDVGFRS